MEYDVIEFSCDHGVGHVTMGKFFFHFLKRSFFLLFRKSVFTFFYFLAQKGNKRGFPALDDVIYHAE